ncbi:hypothetical protein KUV22_11250 [Microbulbifer agarilyticus]|uniref:hypothetical protein n=1 Tax=Microbulbifer agarilyticus TaxID=260552 RepID=UPI001C954269|nr:hypothetical protein [Microbulbifer agarilyticus]MBY6190997.1 hypothetical protein [Microbulbifer agarilyticus]
MPPVAAVSLVFSLVLGVVLWIYLIRLSVARSSGMGVVALLLPPLAFIQLLTDPEHREQLLVLFVSILLFSSIAALER